MKIDGSLFLAIIITLALIPGTCAESVSLGGGTSMTGSGSGITTADSNDAMSQAISEGFVSEFHDNYWVEDYTGKRAEVSIDVINGIINDYSWSLKPDKDPARQSVSADIDASVEQADHIDILVSAKNSKNIAEVGTHVNLNFDDPRSGSIVNYRGSAKATDNDVTASQKFDSAEGKYIDGSLYQHSSDFGGGASGSLLEVMNGQVSDYEQNLKTANDGLEESIKVDQAEGSIVFLSNVYNSIIVENGELSNYDGFSTYNVDGEEGAQKIGSAAGSVIEVFAGSDVWKYPHTQTEDSIDLTLSKADGLDAKFNGKTGSYASNKEATSSAYLKGSALGALQSIGTANNANSDEKIQQGDSNGKLILADLDLKASASLDNTFVGGAGTFYVDDDKPANKIQDAVNAAWDGDTIKVAEGTYLENVDIEKSVEVSGSKADKTIVDGNQAGPVFTIGITNPNANVALAGLTITNGKADFGGGIANYGTVDVKGCTISKNNALTGGGIDNLGTATVSGSTISGNSAEYGGGISNGGTIAVSGSTIYKNSGSGVYNWLGSVSSISGSTISGNTGSDGYGGGIYNVGTTTVSDSKVSGNSAEYGGGFYNQGSILTISGSTISGNSAEYGGGIYNGNIATISDSFIYRNYATNDGGGIFNSYPGTLLPDPFPTSQVFNNHLVDITGPIDNISPP